LHFRAHARRVIRLRATLAQAGAGDRDAQVLNLGMGGACVALSLAEPLEPGEHVTVSFLAPTLWDPLAFPARVAWAHAPLSGPGTTSLRVGLAFEPTDPAAVYALFELLTTMSF